jgi:RNA polymerase sigma-70 factor (ECF subfamily)
MSHWLYQRLSDEALMRVYAAGRSKAFESLYQRHRVPLFNFLRRQCGGDAVAEELAQDTWVAVIKQSSNYTVTAKFTTWLYRIAHNRLVDHWRKFGPTANVVTEEFSESLASTQRTSHRARLNELLDQLQSLPPEQLTTLLLKIEGFSRQEIAEITDAKPETVKSRLRYAKAQLKSLVEAES